VRNAKNLAEIRNCCIYVASVSRIKNIGQHTRHEKPTVPNAASLMDLCLCCKSYNTSPFSYLRWRRRRFRSFCVIFLLFPVICFGFAVIRVRHHLKDEQHKFQIMDSSYSKKVYSSVKVSSSGAGLCPFKRTDNFLPLLVHIWNDLKGQLLD
jgi:hypothetical protein